MSDFQGSSVYLAIYLNRCQLPVFSTTLYAYGGKASIYDLRSIIENYMEAKQLVLVTCTFFLTDEVPTLTQIFQNEFNVSDTLYLTVQTKRKVSFDCSFAVCCGQSSTYDDNTEIEYESETSSLSYSFARHLTQALQSHKLYLISPEPVDLKLWTRSGEI